MNIGLVGVGRMGANMARRLKDRGFHVTTLFDVNRGAVTALAQELGSSASPTLGDVSAGADVIFTIVTDDAAMREIFTGADNLLANAKGKLFVNCATVSPAIHVEVEKLAEAAGAAALEACMASSITQAREGSLYLMCGGREENFRRAEPILKELSSSLRYIGKSGEAAKVKALVNMVMNINTAGLGKGLALGTHSDSISRCCAKCFLKPAPRRVFFRRTVKTCRTEITPVSSRRRTRRKTVGSRSSSRKKMDSICRSPAKRRRNTTAWLRPVWESWINPESRS